MHFGSTEASPSSPCNSNHHKRKSLSVSHVNNVKNSRLVSHGYFSRKSNCNSWHKRKKLCLLSYARQFKHSHFCYVAAGISSMRVCLKIQCFSFSIFLIVLFTAQNDFVYVLFLFSTSGEVMCWSVLLTLRGS